MRRLALLTLTALLCASCHSGTDRSAGSGQPTWQVAEEQPVQNSGRELVGDFVVRSIDDPYLSKDSVVRRATRYSFGRNGTFKRVRGAPGQPSAAQEGTYIIGTHNELVLYVEKVGPEFLDAARVEHYMLEEEPGGRVRLRYGPVATIVLEKSSGNR